MSFTSVMMERDSQTPGFAQAAQRCLPSTVSPPEPHKRERGHSGVQQGEAHVPVPKIPWLGHTWFDPFWSILSPTPAGPLGFTAGPAWEHLGAAEQGARDTPEPVPPLPGSGTALLPPGDVAARPGSSISIPSWHQLCLSLPAPFCIAPCPTARCSISILRAEGCAAGIREKDI